MYTPNFFIVGAPKCGTTALASYLADHPDVFMSNPKEPLYYLDERDPNRKIVDRLHYGSLFKNAEGCVRTGEASVWYLYSTTALNAIRANHPGAKIIIMTREPVGFVASLHSQLVFGGWDTDEDLALAWKYEKQRLEDCSLEELETIEVLYNWRAAYPELAKHQKYVKRYQSAFGDNNVLVLDHAELKRDTADVYYRTLDFLGLRRYPRSDFEIINANKTHRSERVKALLHWLDRQRWLVSCARSVKSTLGIGSFGIYERIQRANVVEIERPKVSIEIAADIENYVQTMP